MLSTEVVEYPECETIDFSFITDCGLFFYEGWECDVSTSLVQFVWQTLFPMKESYTRIEARFILMYINEDINIPDVFKWMFSNITGTPKARVQYFCAVGRQAFLKAYRRRFCLHNQTPKNFGRKRKKKKSLQEDQRPLIPFSVVGGVCLGKIGHEIYVTETWRVSQLKLNKLFGDP